MSLQSDLQAPSISSYSRIEIKDKEEKEENNNEQNKMNRNTIIIKNIKDINCTTYSVNSDQTRPILHKYFYSKLGNTHSFFADEKGNPKIIIGPHWPLFAGVIAIFTIVFIIMIYFFKKYNYNTNYSLTYFIYFLFLISYSITALINPGYPLHDENSLNNKNKNKTGYCTICKIYISLEKNTKHCNFCNICVEGMDHHCPWTGKCIGRKNISPFFIFLISIITYICYCMISIMQFMNEIKKNNKKK